MSRITSRVTTEIVVERPPERVWRELEQIENHITWMRDAKAIRFIGPMRRGIGTTFECDTKIGPIALTDRMQITSWNEGSLIAVRHDGVVSGSGQFSLEAHGGSTVVRWEERLVFPWWLGSRLGSLAARPVFTLLWRGNLARLRRQIEAEN
jgi:carbon monoxide dehydrogenase subunit G